MTKKFLITLFSAAAAVGLSAPAEASLTTFQTFTGRVGYSADGFGSTSQSGTISASVPVGATVLAAYLYTGMFNGGASYGGTLGGVAAAYGPAVVNTSQSILASARADVTAIVRPIIDGGPGGTYNFAITETSAGQDGEALVVVYSLPTLAIATVGILDGFAATGGDTASINFSAPLDPTDPGFFAEMSLGINFSFGAGQTSQVRVNGTLITANAGNFDDGQGSNGGLITVGGFNDPFSLPLPSHADDHERYNLQPYVTIGDMSITVNTRNPSNDDNIFLATFYVSGLAGINEPPPDAPVPEPTTLALLGAGIFGLAARRRRA